MWIARDKNQRLYIYKNKPERGRESFEEDDCYRLTCFEISQTLFPEVTWENSPVEVELKIKGNVDSKR